MTTFTNISDTSFIINFVTSGFDSTEPTFSKRVKHNEMEWCLKIFRLGESLACFVQCLGNKSNEWNVTATVSVKLLPMGNRSAIVFERFEDANQYYNPDHQSPGWFDFIKLNELKSKYATNGCITLECTVNILSIVGNYPARIHNFSENDEMSDVAFLVEGKTLNVNRAILAHQSPVFKAMFYSEFVEKNSKSIEIKEVKYVEFEAFMQFMYQCSVEITRLNVSGLLTLADRYDVPKITRKCEKYLISTIRVSRSDKLQFAEIFRLNELMKAQIELVETLEKLRASCVKMESREVKTLTDLLTKAMAIIEKQKSPAVPNN